MLTKIKENSKLVITSACFLVMAIALSYKLTKQQESGVESDYHLAHLNLQKLRGGDNERLAQLQKILKKRPNFKRAMDPVIVQHLLDQKRTGEAKGYLKAYTSRLKNETPYHKQFSHTSFVISEGDLVLALTEAKGLLQKLPDGKLELLKAFNLLRIALLEKMVGTKKEEMEAWQQVEALDETLLSSLYEVFHVREVTLKDFIKHRKSLL